MGKHLLIACAGGLVVETHLQMAGTWQLVRTGDRWPRPAHLLRCRLDVDGWQALCFSAPQVRTWPAADVDTHRSPLAHLGPDLRSGRRRPGRSRGADVPIGGPTDAVGDVLLDQRMFLRGRQRLPKRGVLGFEAAPLNHADDAARRPHAKTLGGNIGPATSLKPGRRAEADRAWRSGGLRPGWNVSTMPESCPDGPQRPR